jgi:hypothetical protein
MGANTAAVPVPAQPVQGALRIPSVLWCGFMIFAVKMALATRGFGWTARWIRRRVEVIPQVASVDLKALKLAESAVAMAAALYPGRALCLEQSLVLYYLLRRQGIPVRYCHGVQPHPFLAHAWVEYDSEPLNDVAEHVKHFARLTGQSP